MAEQPRPLQRTVTAIRRNGWDRAHVERALAALSATLSSATNTDTVDDELARELLRWLQTDPEAIVDLRAPEDLPLLPTGLVPVASLLQDSDESRIEKLREQHANPTGKVIEILDELEPEEYDDWQGPTALAQNAIETLGQLGTVAGVRYMCTFLERDDEPLHEVVRRAIGMVPGIVEVTLELWSTSESYARQMMLEAVARARKHDDRVLALVVDWLANSDDFVDASIAACDYQDARVVPYLQAALTRALDVGQQGAARELVAYLEHYGAGPDAQQRSRLSRFDGA